MRGKAGRQSAGGIADKLPAAGAVGLVLGAVLMLAGLVMLVINMTSSVDPGLGRTIAEQNADAMTGAINDINHHLRHESVVAAARQVPEAAPEESAPVVEALAGRGLTDLVDVRVFPPRVEEIEVGSYPDPDFAVVQMLVEARRRGTASARVRHEGTADEHLAMAAAMYDEAEEVEAIVLLRVPVELVVGRMTSPDQGFWIRLVQQGRVLRSLPEDTPADAAAAGHLPVEGSAIAVEWGAPPARAGLPPEQAMLLIVGGLLLAIIGVALRSNAVGRLVNPPAREPSPATPAAASPPTSEPPPAASPESRPAATGATPPPGPEATEPKEPKPDLPDWLLDEGDGPQDLPFGDSKHPDERQKDEAAPPDSGHARDSAPASAPEVAPEKESSPASSDGGLELDVPDLDEILAQIEDADESESAPESSDDDRPASGDLEFSIPGMDDEPDSRLHPEESGPAVDEVPPESPAGEDLSLLDLDAVMDDEDKSDGQSVSDDEAPLTLERDESIDTSTDQLADQPAESVDELFDVAPSTLDAESDSEAGSSAEPEPETEPQPEPEEPDELAGLFATVAESDLFSPGMFKAGGIRGVVDQSLDAERATMLGRAIGTMAVAQGHHSMVVGRDGRVSGPLMMSAVIRGLRNAGVDVIEAGSVPAPALWHAASEMADGCGVMVSASHHGPSENGFQVMLGGRMLGREQLLEAAVIAIGGQFAEGDGGYVQENVARTYATALADTVALKRPLKVVVDCGNGVAGNIVPVLFEALELDLIPLYCDVDGSFPNHRPDPTDPECLEDLRLCVRNFRADLGFAFDGDGDQLALVSNDSEVAGTDQVLMLLARAMLASEPGAAVVMDVRGSGRLAQLVEKAGGRAVMAPAGGVPVARAMVDEDAALGGDMDGQIIVSRRWYPFGDAICAAVRLLELFADGRQAVQEWLDDLPESRTTGALPVALDAASGRQLVRRLRAKTDFGDAQVATIDGLRVDFPDRWGLVRVSVDDDRLELHFGGHDPAALTQIKTEFRDWLLAVDPDLPLPY